MLVEQTLEKLNAMKLYGMANYLRTWTEWTADKDLGPMDLVGLLVDAAWVHRENRKLTSRLRNARLRQTACLEGIDYSLARRLTKAQVLELSTSRWVAQAQHVLVTGPTGVGKRFLACALGQEACRDGYGMVYRRASRLLRAGACPRRRHLPASAEQARQRSDADSGRLRPGAAGCQ